MLSLVRRAAGFHNKRGGHIVTSIHPAEASLSLTLVPCQGLRGCSVAHPDLSVHFSMGICKAVLGCFLSLATFHLLSVISPCFPDNFPQGEPRHRLWVLHPRGEEGGREAAGEREGDTQREAEGARAREGTSSQYVHQLSSPWQPCFQHVFYSSTETLSSCSSHSWILSVAELNRKSQDSFFPNYSRKQWLIGMFMD